MNKTNNTLFFMSLGAVVVFSILVIFKPRCHHKGVGENTGKSIDNRLKDLAEALDKATQFVQQALNQTS